MCQDNILESCLARYILFMVQGVVKRLPPFKTIDYTQNGLTPVVGEILARSVFYLGLAFAKWHIETFNDYNIEYSVGFGNEIFRLNWKLDFERPVSACILHFKDQYSKHPNQT